MTDRTFELLATLIDVSPLTRKEISLRLGHSASYLAGIFHRSNPLRIDDFLTILCELEVPPDDFFLLVVAYRGDFRYVPRELSFVKSRCLHMARMALQFDPGEPPEKR